MVETCKKMEKKKDFYGPWMEIFKIPFFFLTFLGILTAICFDHISTSSLFLRHYLTIAVGMLLVAAMTYMVLIQMGLDPHWSITKAEKWCAHKEWVHLTTTLFFSVAKASSSLVGRYSWTG